MRCCRIFLMLAFQSETGSQHSSSQNSPLCCTQVVSWQKNYFLFWLTAVCLFTFTQIALDLLAGLFVRPSKPSKWIVDWFWVPTEGWKENAPWTKKFRFSFKVNFHLKPCIILNLKMWILKMRAPQAFFFYFLKSSISKWENGWKMNWPPIRNIPPPLLPVS